MFALEQIPLSLYVHIPWCVRKCPYCDFNSHVAANTDEIAYVDHLLADLAEDLALSNNRTIQSIFIGGGTPSLFSAEAIDKLLSGVAAQSSMAEDIEVTLEANPGTLEAGRYAGFRQAGVNRLSIGVQSLDNQKLQSLGRIHSSQNVVQAFESARDAGFENINLDLMYGLPEQSQSQALDDLQKVIDLTPEHLSWYQLTLEPNTLFHSQPPPLPDDDALWEMMQQGQALLADSGYQQYEISAYAKADRRCRHNLNYWQFGDYIGVGAGAHGKLTQPSHILRRRKHRHPNVYQNGSYLSTQTVIPNSDLPIEFMLNAMRLNEGVEAAVFEQRTGLKLDAIQALLDQARQLDLMHKNPERLQPTSFGLQYLNNLLSLFEP